MDEGIVKKTGVAIFKGEIISLIINFIGLIILSLIMTYSNFSDNNISTIIIAINTIAILIGSSLSTIRLDKNGIINLLIILFLYIIIYLLISLIFKETINFSTKTIILFILVIIAGGIGGIIGVNLNKKAN